MQLSLNKRNTPDSFGVSGDNFGIFLTAKLPKVVKNGILFMKNLGIVDKKW